MSKESLPFFIVKLRCFVWELNVAKGIALTGMCAEGSLSLSHNHPHHGVEGSLAGMTPPPARARPPVAPQTSVGSERLTENICARKLGGAAEKRAFAKLLFRWADELSPTYSGAHLCNVTRKSSPVDKLQRTTPNCTNAFCATFSLVGSALRAIHFRHTPRPPSFFALSGQIRVLLTLLAHCRSCPLARPPAHGTNEYVNTCSRQRR